MRKLPLILLVVMSFGIFGCADINTGGFKGDSCQILTPSLDFGDVIINATASATAGIQCLESTTVTIAIGDASNSFSFPPEYATQDVTPGSTASVKITFAPKTTGGKMGAVQFKDSNGKQYDVLLTGNGINGTF